MDLRCWTFPEVFIVGADQKESAASGDENAIPFTYQLYLSYRGENFLGEDDPNISEDSRRCPKTSESEDVQSLP